MGDDVKVVRADLHAAVRRRHDGSESIDHTTFAPDHQFTRWLADRSFQVGPVVRYVRVEIREVETVETAGEQQS